MEFIKKYLSLIILLGVGFLPLIPLFHAGIPFTHDGKDHVARIANFYLSLSEGNIVPRWGGNLNWGYGHPILMFLYPLPSYISSLFHFVGFSFVDSVKLTFGVTYILSGIAMYFWIRNVFGEKAGVVSGILYMYAPYRFVDLYVRGAIGEHVAFLFVPLIFYFLLKVSKRFSYWYVLGGTVSLAGLLLSHNALAIMFLPVACLYGIYLLWRVSYKRELLLAYIFMLLVGFGLSAFFIMPAFLEGKYTLRDIVTGTGGYKQGFVSIFDYINLGWNYGGSLTLPKQIGVVQVVLVLLGSIVLIKSPQKKELPLYGILLISLLVSLVLMLPFTDFIWANVSLLQKFQFPWRLLSVVVFTTAALSSFIFLNSKKGKKLTIATVLIGVSVIVLYYPYYKTQGYFVKPESFYTGTYYGTTDTGESSPIWSVRFMEHPASAAAEVIDGTASIEQISRTTTEHTYTISVESDNARIRENTLYFPNWQVLVDGSPTQIEFQDMRNRGLITFYVPKGEHTVMVKFFDTTKRIIANYISILSVLALIILYILLKNKRIKKSINFK